MSHKTTLKDWCITHKKYHGMVSDDCSIVRTRDILGNAFIEYMESRGVIFEDVYPVRMAKKKGNE